MAQDNPQFFESPLGAVASDLESQAAKTLATIPEPSAPQTFTPEAAATPAAPVKSSIQGALPQDAALLRAFQDSSRKHGVPINILMALAQQESGYNPMAVGQPTKWGRAKGLMQNLDATAKGLGINPFDPVASIDAAARQYAERIRKGDTPIEAVRAHFGGDNRDQWGPKTQVYGDEVMKRAGDIGALYASQFSTPEGQAENDRLPRSPRSRAPFEPALPRSPRSRTGDDAPTALSLGQIVAEETRNLPEYMFGETAGTAVRDQVNKLIGSGASLASAVIDAINPDPTPGSENRLPDRAITVPGITGYLQRADARTEAMAEGLVGAAGDALQWAAGNRPALSGIANAGKGLSARRDAYNDQQARDVVAEDARRAAIGQPSLEAERKDSVVNKVGDVVAGFGARRSADQSQGQQARDQALNTALDKGPGALLGYVARHPIDTASSVVAPTIPYFVPGAVAGRGAGGLARAAGASAETAGAVAGNAGIIAGGAAASFGNAQQGAEEVAKMDKAQLQQLPAYQKLIAEGMDDQQARNTLADRAYTTGLPTSALFNLVTMGIPAKLRLNVFEDWVAGRAPKIAGASTAARIAAGSGIEFATEMPQGAGDQLSQNLGEVAAGTRKPGDIGDKVLSSGVLEGLVGAGMGAATGGLAHTEGSGQSADAAPEVVPTAPRDPDSSAPGGMLGAAVSRAEGEAMQAGIEAAMGSEVEPPRITARTPLEGDVSGTLERYQPDGKGGWAATILGDDGNLRHYTDKDGVQLDGLPGQMEGRSAETQQADGQDDAAAKKAAPAVKPAEVDEFAPVRQLNLRTGRKAVSFPDETHAQLFDLGQQRAQGRVDGSIAVERLAEQAGIPVSDVAAKADAYRREVIVQARDAQGDDFVAPRALNQESADVAGNDRAPGAEVAAQAGEGGQASGTADAGMPAGRRADTAEPVSGVRNDLLSGPQSTDANKALSDEAYQRAVELVRSTGKVSISAIQRETKLGYGPAASLVTRMEADGVISPAAADGRRTVIGQAEAAPEPVSAADTLPAAAAAAAAGDVKWFGTKEKADAHVAKKGLAGTHQVVQNGRRFEIQPRTDAVAEAAAEAATSPTNDRPEPTQAQKEAGNYAKGHIRIAGMDVSIENPAGTRRQPEWAPLAHDYGYIRRTEGADGDHVDVFMGPNATDADNPVFVIDQVNEDGSFDEHKVMLGFPSAKAARDGYLANYQPGWKGLGGVRKMGMDEFKRWVASPDARKPLSANVKAKAPAQEWKVGDSVQTPFGTREVTAIAGKYLVYQVQANSDVTGDKSTGTILATDAKPPKGAALANATAPEHVQVGVDDRELGQIVKEFNSAQASMIEDGNPVTRVFQKPAASEVVRLADKVKVYHKDHGWMSVDEAKAKIAEWRQHALDQYEDTDTRHENGQKVVLSLFDLSGEWSKPWEEAGYEVYRFDIQDNAETGDVNNFSTEFFTDWFGDFDGKDIYAILAACPCTDFAVSGARHFAAKDEDGRTVASVRLVHQTLRAIEYFKPAVWALENPVGRIEKLGGLPPWRMSFDPNHLGDPYTKKTLLWGRFNGDLPVAPVEPTEGSKMHRMYGGKSQATKNARSVTPEGFSYGFFMANNAADHPAMALSWKFDRLDSSLIEQAIEAGVTPQEITDAVEDHFYDMDDDAANQAIRDLLPQEPAPKTSTKDEAPTEPEPTPPKGGKPADSRFANNKLFTSDRVDAARERLKSKLGQLNSGFDPEMLLDGMTIAGAYIEAGTRSFADYAKAMTEDLGAGIRPYLLSFYEGVRNYPGLDTKGMTPADEAARLHAALTKATPATADAAGTKAAPPAQRKKATGNGAGRQLRQDWGVPSIDGFTPIEGGKNQQTDYGLKGGVKDAFLADAKGYLREVAAQLEKAGFTAHPERGSKKANAVGVNEGGPAGSGDVSLTMQGPNGQGVYATIGATALRGVVSTNQQGISVMFRVTPNGDRYGGRSNQWADAQYTAGELAEIIRRDVERVAAPAAADQGASAAAGDAARDQRAGAEGVPAAAVERGVGDDSGRADGAVRGERGRGAGDGAGPAEPAGQQAVRTGPGEAVPAVRVAEAGSAGERAVASDRANRRALADYRYQPGELTRDRGWKGTAERNIEAVELVKKLEAEGRPATPDERALLARFTGWGASEIANGIFPDPSTGRFKPEWQALGERLRAAMTDSEYAAARRSTQYAHYTGAPIVRSIYDALGRLGFAGGRVLEPGAGIGLFKGLMPEGMAANTKYHGIEVDPITGGIAKALYPESNIQIGDYTETAVPKGHYDAAIGNPPFANIKVTNDPEYRAKAFQLHDYFFAKTIDRVRPGGLVVFITSKGTMDKASSRARQYLADRADLLGAVRLPQTAFKENAGTETVTDVLFLRRREAGEAPAGQAWLGTESINTPRGRATVNEYFATNPQMVLGDQTLAAGRFGKPEYTVVPREGRSIEDQFAAAINELPAGAYRPARGSIAERAAVIDRDFNPKAKKEGSVYVDDAGKLRVVDQGSGAVLDQRINSSGKAVALKPKEVQFLTDYVGLRDALKQAQFDQLNDGDWEASLGALNAAYDAFTKAHGPILAHTVSERDNADGSKTITTRWKNNALLRLDAEDSLVRALEDIKEDGTIVRSKMLTGRTLNRPAEPVINSVQDALLVALNQSGRLDMDQVAQLAGTSKKEAIEELGAAIYNDPGTGWTTADAYLSGNVVRKLKEARQAAKSDPNMRRNVAALEAVQPAPLAPTDISAQLGAHWVPSSDVSAFASEVIGQKIGVTYHPLAKSWSVSEEGTRQVSEWGMAGMPAADILEAVLNNRQIRLTTRVPDGNGGWAVVVDPVATEQANNIAKKMRGQFASWLWSSPQRADRLAKFYNEHFNNIVPRAFDGRHLTLPGISSRIALYDHQKRAIWRMIQDGDTYLAHSVGSGKTFTMIAAGMEERRLGLTKRPMYVVPNHMLAQFSREFYELYPTAHVMVADEENFHTSQRQQFVARAALNDPDAIVITHSAFSRIGMSPEFADSYIQAQIAEYEAVKEEASDDRVTVKQAERRIEQLEKRLSGKSKKESKDRALTFEELGADRLFVDEFHEFRKLDFATNRSSVKGIDPSGSARAMDLHMKVQYLQSKNPGRALVAASGTPVTNTMGELFTAQRFMQPEQLAEDGLDSFDAWASQFGEVVEGFEQNAAGGYEIVSRFAKFVNVPDLMRRVRSFMDILTSEQLGDLVQRPTVEGGGREIVVTPSPSGYRAYQKTLEERIKLIRARKGKVQPGDDIILSVISDGRFSAIDMRFVDPESEPDPNSKLNRLLDDAIRSYHDTSDWQYSSGGKADPLTGGAMMLFTDIGLGEASAKNRGFDMKAWTFKRLTEGGVKPEHIAFMRDNKAHAKKAKLFADMRSGKVRILIGGKDMETGVNAQKRLTDLFHLDAPWFPASVEQREGRIIRQGNQNKSVRVRAYATKGSYDSTMWGMNARKQRFITQALQGNDSVRSMEDVSEASSFEMASALASGDERYLKMAGLRSDVERLGRLYSAHEREQRDLRSELVRLDSSVKFRKKLAEQLASAIKKRKPVAGDAFSATVDGVPVDEREAFGIMLYDKFKALADANTEESQSIGKIGGFDITYSSATMRGSNDFVATADIDIPGDPDALLIYPIDPNLAIKGIAVRATNQVMGLDRRLSDTEARITEMERRTEQVQSRIGAVFPEMAEMVEKQQALEDLEVELSSENVQIAEGQNGQPVEVDGDVPAAADEYRNIVPQPALSPVVPEQARVRTLERLKKLRSEYQAGNIDEAQYISSVSELTDAIEQRNSDRDYDRFVSDRVRGADWARERLTRARRLGELEPGTVDFALWLLDQNEAAANDLGLSIRQARDGSPAGLYTPQSRVATLFMGNADAGTAVHEILHHTERMMPPDVQDGIIREHRRALEATWRKSDPAVRAALEELIYGSMGDNAAWDRAMKAFANGTLDYQTHYPLTNASEFWAVNATDILGGRFRTRGSWIGSARRWLGELIERAKGMLGLRSDAPVLRGLRRVLNGNGERMSMEMLGQRARGQDAPAAPLANISIDPDLLEINGSGESSASMEAINRIAEERELGRVRLLIDRDGSVRPLLGVDAVDAVARDGQVIVQRGIGRDEWTVLSQGSDISNELAQGKINRSREALAEMVEDLTSDVAYSVAPIGSTNSTAAGSGSAGYTPRTVRGAVLVGPDGPAIARVISQGGIKFQDQAPASAPKGVSAWTDADGTINLLNSIPPEIAKPVLLHEAFHGRVMPLIGEAAWGTVMGELDGLARRAIASDGSLSKAWTDAMERVQAARRQGDPNISDAMTVEEFGAYAVENAEQLPPGIRTWAKRLMGAVKAWVMRRFGKQLGEITPEQLRALAVSALRDAGTAQRMVTRGQEDVRLYSAEQREQAVDQAESDLAPSDESAQPSWRGRLNRDLSRVRNFFHHPRHIAAIFREFTPVYLTAVDQGSARDNIITDLNRDYENYAALTQEGKERVNAALELGRLTSKVFTADELAAGITNPGFRPAVRYDQHGNTFRYKQPIHATASKAKDVITLQPDEIAAYGSIRSMFDRALDMFAEQAMQEMGFPELAGLQHSPDQLTAKVKEIAADIAAKGGSMRQLENAAKFMADIAQSKRQGYVPFARYGDYVIAVKSAKASINYVKNPDGGFIARGVPHDMQAFMEGIGAVEHPTEDGWAVTARQRKLLDEENNQTVYAERIETGLRDMLPEARAKWLEGRARDIPAVAAAYERIKAEWAGPNSGNVVLEPFRVDKKRPEDGIKVTDLDTLATVANLDQDTWAEVRDALQDAIQAQGFRKHFFNANNVPGYSKDFERAITDYMGGIAGYLSRRQHNDRWDNAIKAIKAERLHQYAVRYRDYVNSPGEEFALMRQAGYMMYIAGSVASGTTNLTQLALMTYPALGQIASPVRVAYEMSRAAKDVMKMFRVSRNVGLNMFDPSKAPADVRDDLIKAWDSGDFVPQATFEIMATANQRNVGARRWRRNIDRASQVVGLTFSVPERINRLTTYIAAHRLAKLPSVRKAAANVFGRNELAKRAVLDNWSPSAFGEYMVEETQFRMGKTNRPTLMRGPGAAILQFKGFVWQSLEAWSRMIRLQGKRGATAAAMSIGIMLGLSGLWGFPGADDARKVMEASLKFFMERDVDLKTKLRQVVYDTTGSQWMSAAVGRGAPFAAGLDMGRVGMGNVAPQTDTLEDLMGIPYDMLVRRPIGAVAELRNGNPVGAASNIAPNFARNLIQAGQYTTRGVRNNRGQMVMAPEQMEASDVVLKGLGWTPTQITAQRDYNYAQYRMQTATDAYKARMADRIAKTLALMSRTQDADTRAELNQQIRKAYADIAEFNESVPAENRVGVTNTMVRNRVQKELMGSAAGFGRERGQARGASADLRELYGVGQRPTEGGE